MVHNTALALTEPSGRRDADDLVPINVARSLLRSDGRSVARQTVFSLAVRREIIVRHIAGRYLVPRHSIDAYRARHGIQGS
jgi:hypothetical protein